MKTALSDLDQAIAARAATKDDTRLPSVLWSDLPLSTRLLFTIGGLVVIGIMFGIALYADHHATPENRLASALTEIEDELAGMLMLPEGSSVSKKAIEGLSSSIGDLAHTALGLSADGCRDRMAGYAIHAGDDLVTYLTAYQGALGPEFHGNARQFLDESRKRLDDCRAN